MENATLTMRSTQGQPRTYRFDPNRSQVYESSGLSLHCLEDDIRYALKPSLAKPDARVDLTLANVTPQQIYDCFSESSRGRDSSYALEHFIEMTGIELLSEGSRAVELVEAQGRFFVSGVYPGSWQIDGTDLKQASLPPSDTYNERFSQDIVVPDRDHFIFRNQTLTPKYTAELRTRLQMLDGWLRATMPGSGLSMEEAQMETQVAILRLTTPMGWPPRPTPTGMTGSYLADRTLRFRAFAAELRSSIIDGMNVILERFGNRHGFTAKLAVVGLRSAEEFKDVRGALAGGFLRPDVAQNYW